MSDTRTNLRHIMLALVTLAVMLFYGGRIVRFQIVEAAQYSAQANQPTIREQTIKAARGEILDRYGRPLAINVRGFDIVIDKAYVPRGTENDLISMLVRIMRDEGEAWIDNLPITETAPFAFKEGYENSVSQLKKMLNLGEYATVGNVMHWLKDRYRLSELSDEEARPIIGVRYEMERTAYSISAPYKFAANLKITTVTKVRELSYLLPGARIEESAIRQYVNGDIAPHLVGIIGPIYTEELAELKEKGYALNDVVGKSGIEQAYESLLRGVDGKRWVQTASNGEVLATDDYQPAIPGNTIVLTIDIDLQKAAYDALEKQILNLQQTAPAGKGKEAEAGAVAVVHIPTGEVLALVTYPSYDLTTYNKQFSSLSQDPLKPLFNRGLQGTYNAGSTYKMVVAIAGLSEGIITPTSTVNCTQRYTYFSGYQPTCAYYHGHINVETALRHSCNIFFYDVGRRLGIDKINEYSIKLGLGAYTGIELRESAGTLSSPQLSESRGQIWNPGNVLQASIGQLDNMFTPLQLATYAATIANRGKRMNTSIIQTIKSYTLEETVFENTPMVVEEIDAPLAFETVIKGMVAASRIGTARNYFANYPIDIASKTGTPEAGELLNSAFVCFDATDNPEIAIAVIIEKGYQGYTGAPVARDILNAYFADKQHTLVPQAYGVLLE